MAKILEYTQFIHRRAPLSTAPNPPYDEYATNMTGHPEPNHDRCANHRANHRPIRERRAGRREGLTRSSGRLHTLNTSCEPPGSFESSNRRDLSPSAPPISRENGRPLQATLVKAMSALVAGLALSACAAGLPTAGA